jgi:hypothetical protein
MPKYGQKIIDFLCRPCAEYHLKTRSHYRAMKRQKLKVKKAKLAALASVADFKAAPKPR